MLKSGHREQRRHLRIRLRVALKVRRIHVLVCWWHFVEAFREYSHF